MGADNPRIFPDASYYHNAGTSPLEIWYAAGNMLAVTPATTTNTLNFLHATPFISGIGGNLDRLAMECTALGNGSKIRFGLYTSTNDGNMYPDQLLVDSGEFDCSAATGSTGVKSATVAVTLRPNKVYWVACLQGGTTSATYRRPVIGAQAVMLGDPTALNTDHNVRVAVAQSYGAMPGTFPGLGAFTTTGAIGVWLRWAS